METMKYKDFQGSVQASFKDECLHGKILFINDLVTYEAPDFKTIKKEFMKAVDDYLKTCEALKIEPFKSFSGSFNVRMVPELHQALASYAIKNDKNINTVVKEAVEEHINESEQAQEVHNHYYSFTETVEEFQEFGDISKDADIIQFEDLRQVK